MNTLATPRVASLLDRLFAEAETNQPEWQLGDELLVSSKTGYRDLYARMKDVALPVSRETGTLLYTLLRSTGARSVVEFGLSFGLSTICLAAALRDNGGGRIVTTEFEPSKAERARAHLAEAGLLDLVEIREGDALQTLAYNLPHTVDLVLLDGAKPLYADVLRLLEPQLHPGSLILADDVHFCPEFVDHMRSNFAHYLSVPLTGDLELSMRL